ncbi:type I restriction-modification system specificity determinant XF2741 [Roseobacter sp. AzwK-3b]|nr:type I restriction-modification system specificity determinant XF2741 [Roseobacter sp. AzwK-3b]
MNWADQDYAIGRGLAAIRHQSGEKFQPWIRGIIEAQLSGLLNAATGSTFPNVSKDQLHNLEVPDHSPFEQEEIASILGALDNKIELNRQTAATLEEMARALYRSWFVDFDPVKAKAEGLAPAFMDEATAALFPDRFGEGGLPEGWTAGTLGDLIEFNPRERITKGADVPYLDMKALPTSGMIADPAYQRTFTSGTKFREGDTLLARITPCLENGKTAMVDDLLGAEVGWGSTEFIVMRSKPGVPSALPYCVARDPDFRDEAIATMNGSSGRQRADAKSISQLKCAVPPVMVLTSFGQQTAPMIARIHAFGRENQTLAALRDTLLPKLMSGELRVGEAREQIEEVA